jgi:hypothetical protein
LPRYFSIVFALAGDSTITSDLLIAILITNPTLRCQACLTHKWRPAHHFRGKIQGRSPRRSLREEKATAKVGRYHETPLHFHYWADFSLIRGAFQGVRNERQSPPNPIRLCAKKADAKEYLLAQGENSRFFSRGST